MILPLVASAVLALSVAQSVGSAPADSVARAADRQPTAAVGIEPDTVTLGDPFLVRIRVRGAPADARVSFGDFTLVEPVEAIESRVVEQGAAGEWTAIYQLRAWAVSDSLIGTFPFRIRTTDGSAEDHRVQVALPVVRSVLPADSSLHTPRPAKGAVPLSVGSPAAPHPWLMWVVGGLLAGLLLVLLLVRRRGAPVIAPRDPRTAALAELRQIEDEGLPEAGDLEVYHVRVSRVLRRYIAACQGGGEDLSSAEIVQVLEASGADPEMVKELAALLRRADRVKFAGTSGRDDSASASAFGAATRDWILNWPARVDDAQPAEAA